MTTLAENDVAAGQPRTKPAPLPLAQVDEPTVSVRLVVRLLGPLEVACGDRPVRIGAAKERLLLVLLALNAGRVVAAERLIDALWGEDPPESAGVSLRVLISRLRKSLAAAGCDHVIHARPPGYVLVGDAVDVDVDRFQALAARGTAQLAAGSARAAAARRNAPATEPLRP